MIISEEERKEILSKYVENISTELLNHLKRNYPIVFFKAEFLNEPIKFMIINGKQYDINSNKKFLVNKLNSILEDEWTHLDKKVIRRTIKKFIDGFR